MSLQRIPMGGGEKSSPTPVHVQRPFGGEVNKLGEKIVVGRNVWNILFFRESSSPAHDWSVTFGCNVWRIRIDLFFLPSKLNLPIFRFYCDCTIHEFDRNRKKKYNDGRFFFELMIVEILLNIVMSNAFLDFFFKFFEYLKWISKIQNEIFHFFFLNS